MGKARSIQWTKQCEVGRARSPRSNFFSRRSLLLFCTVAIIFLQAQSQSPIEQTEQWKRERDKKLIEQRGIEKQRKLILEKERGIQKKLQQLEAELSLNEAELAQYETEIARNRLRVKEVRVELAKLHERYQQFKKLASKRIRAIYKVGYNGRQFHTMKMLLGTENLADFLKKFKYLSTIAEEDQRLINLLQDQQEEIQWTQAELTQRIEEIKAASKAVEVKQTQILAQKQKYEKLFEQYLTEKEENSYQLEAIKMEIADYDNRLGLVKKDKIAEKAQNIRSIRKDLIGRLPWPVSGQIVSNQTRFDNGITIQAPNGTPVHCIADGIVAKTIPSIVGYGNTVLVTHGDGYISVYSHLADISVRLGETVKAKQVIGKVGDTGSMSGTVLYFELWHNYNRLNTQKWLVKTETVSE